MDKTVIFCITRGVRNCCAALRKGVAMVLLHCEGVLQWFCFAALRGGLAMPYLGGFDCEGVLQWFDFTVLQEGVAITPVYKHYIVFGSLG